MNKLLKRGLKAYSIFLKDKLAMSLMMLFSGVMMAVAAIRGNGNDTKTLPLMILAGGMVFSFWSLYRLGYLKARYDQQPDGDERDEQLRLFLLQILETTPYLVVAATGAFLLANESFTNMALNLMTGAFTMLNGIFGAIKTWKNRQTRNFGWFFILALTIIELGLGGYFVFAFRSIDIGFYLAVGIITTVGGVIEVASTIHDHGFKNALEDCKRIVETFKDS